MRGFAAIAEEIVRLGVRDAFTFMSDDICKLVGELSRRGVRVHHTRHEHLAVGMADGYARSSGHVGVALVGAGVGLTNALNAILTARRAHSEVVVLSGQMAGAGTEAGRLQFKYVDQPALLDAIDVRHLDLSTAASARAELRTSFELARQAEGIVVVNMPEELLEAEGADEPARAAIEPTPAALSKDDQEVMLELLRETWTSRRTVILAGRGAVRAGARDDLLRLGDATGALLATTLMAKGFFGGSPFALGVVGTYATAAASELAGQADLVLAFGASLNYDTTYDGTIFGKARVVHIDSRSAALGKYLAPDLGVVADARLAAAALADELERRGHRVEGYRTADAVARIARSRTEEQVADRGGADGLDPRVLMIELDKRLPARRTVVVDAGYHAKAANRYLSSADGRSHLWPVEYGAIGCALGNALGAAVAHPDRLTVLCIGDGGLMMTLADLDTAARYRLPLLVVVSNNGGLVAELHNLLDSGYSGDDARYENPSFEAVARSLGVEAATVRTIADLDSLQERFRELRGPMLLDCVVTSRAVDARLPSFARARARRQGAPATPRSAGRADR